MFKKFISLVLTLMVLASMAAIAMPATSAAEDTTIYFEVPSNWKNYKKVFCHVWLYGGASLASWQSKKEACTQVEGNIYSYDIGAKVGGLQDGQLYGVIFSLDTSMQTYDLLMSTACYGDTVYCDGTQFENPADSNKTATAAYWKNQDKSVYGPIMGITSIGNIVGTCIAPGETASGLFTSFITGDKLASARTYSKKDDQKLIDDIATTLGLSQDQVEKLIADSGVEIDWKKAESEAPMEEQPIKPDLNGAVGTGQEMTIVYVASAMMIAAAGVIFFARKKRIAE